MCATLAAITKEVYTQNKAWDQWKASKQEKIIRRALKFSSGRLSVRLVHNKENNSRKKTELGLVPKSAILIKSQNIDETSWQPYNVMKKNHGIIQYILW